MPKLIQEFEFYADLAAPHDVGVGPFGHRMIITATGGQVKGERLEGSLVGAGGDWLLVGSDGFGRLDVRATLQTVDGVHIFFQYFGVAELTPPVMAVLSGGDVPTDFGDQYFFTNPRLETGDERYSWVNQTMFVSEGRLLPGPRVEYRVYRVAS